MLKRIIPVILCLVMLFSAGVAAEPDNAVKNDNTSAETQEVSQEENSEDDKKSFEKGGGMPEGMQFPGGNGFPGMENQTETEGSQQAGFTGFLKTYSTPITSVILLFLAFLFVVFYKRKHY